MHTNCDITILNKYIENRETKHRAFHIKNVLWIDSKGVNILQSGMVDADSSTITIPFSSGDGYLPPREYAEKSKDGQTDMSKHFTLQAEDIVIKGQYLGEFTTLEKLNKSNSFVRVVTTVDTNDAGLERLHHWRVGAK